MTGRKTDIVVKVEAVTAEQIHEAVLRRMPDTSLATVYNTLGLFADKGLTIDRLQRSPDRYRDHFRVRHRLSGLQFAD